MISVKDFKKVSLDFRRIASNLLKTDYNNYNIPIHRFKNYIDNEPIIKDIIDIAIEGIEYDYNNCFVKDDFGTRDIDIPINEKEHIKAMYDYMTFLVSNEEDIFQVAREYPYSGKKIAEIIQNFLEEAFKPLIDFITDELSKEILMLEEKNTGNISINGNNGVVNLASNGSEIQSNNTITMNDLKDITDLITNLKEGFNLLEMSSEDKESIIDDLDTMQEQLDNSITKPTRFKKAFNNIKTFLSSSTLLVGTGVALGENIGKLVTLVQPIIDKF